MVPVRVTVLPGGQRNARGRPRSPSLSLRRSRHGRRPRTQQRLCHLKVQRAIPSDRSGRLFELFDPRIYAWVSSGSRVG